MPRKASLPRKASVPQVEFQVEFQVNETFWYFAACVMVKENMLSEGETQKLRGDVRT